MKAKRNASARSKDERRRLFVVAALIVRRGRVLLSQRRADQSFPLSWEFPGGKVEAGETPQEALAREIQEELGCAARIGGVAELIFHAYPDFDLVMPVYRVSVTGQPQPRQVASLAWVPRRRILEKQMPPADVPFARRLARMAKTPSPR